MPAMVRVKVCGITDPEDGAQAGRVGADLVGVVFAEGSPRRVDAGQAVRIVNALPPLVTPVGVFRDEAAARIVSICRRCRMRVVQLHGEESPQMIAALREEGLLVIRAVPVVGSELATDLLAWGADLYLLDVATEGEGRLAGGSGRPVDWDVASVMADVVPVFLAGGLGPENVREAVEAVRPFGVDASSGLESAPGKKDPARVEAFIRAAKGVRV